GYIGNKQKKYVEAAKGTNLFFAIYSDENGNRTYETVPLNFVIERLKQGLKEVPEKNEKGHSLLFYLSPNDLVYVPTEEEKINRINIDFNNLTKEQVQRIYKMEKASDKECYFIRNDIASLIKQYDAKTKYGEFESQNKLQTTMCKECIKIAETCKKLKVDRLGNITEINGKN
ncbi:MAG: type II CRISPR RNA-guided endonuclease Cas9, partial [Prevotellaceae bacterium]|nr:type II CRISPR RNA-guided endonuclease Cas9 [Prevotellaceae bacterium]